MQSTSKSIWPIGIVVALLALAVSLGQALPDRLDSGLHHRIAGAATPRTFGHSGQSQFVVLKAGASQSAHRQRVSASWLPGGIRHLDSLTPSDLVLIESSVSAYAHCPSAQRGRAPPFVS